MPAIICGCAFVEGWSVTMSFSAEPLLLYRRRCGDTEAFIADNFLFCKLCDCELRIETLLRKQQSGKTNDKKRSLPAL